MEFLLGINPWWWVAFGLALGVFEMATMSFFLIWPAIAAVLTAVLLVVTPDATGPVQITFFAILSILLTFIGRYLLERFGDGGPVSDSLNNRANLMIGRHAEVLAFKGPEGHVNIDGIRWRAIWKNGGSAAEGDTVQIDGAEGMTLFVGSSAS